MSKINNPLAVIPLSSCEPRSFLAVVDDEIETPAIIANKRWMRNRFREWQIFCKIDRPLELQAYSWNELGQCLLPRFFKCLVNKKRYCKTTSKIYKVSMERYQAEHFREPVFSDDDDDDVVETYCALVSHIPENDEPDSHVFLQPIVNHVCDVWFKLKVNVSVGSLSKWIKNMCDVCKIKGDFTGKSCRSTAISRMIAGLIPEDVIQSITGHRNPKTLKHYDRTDLVRQLAAQSTSTGKLQGKSFMYSEHLEREMQNWQTKMYGQGSPSPIALCDPSGAIVGLGAAPTPAIIGSIPEPALFENSFPASLNSPRLDSVQVTNSVDPINVGGQVVPAHFPSPVGFDSSSVIPSMIFSGPVTLCLPYRQH